VSARDKKTNARADCRIEGACKGIDPEEIARLVKEAAVFADEDVQYKKQMEIKVELEALAFDVQDNSTNDVAVGKADECLEWLQSVDNFGKPAVGRALERWMNDLRKF